MRKTHGIYPMISLLNMFQLPVHLVYISMINRLSFNYDINPAMLNEGFWWFTDLSSPDPTGILPVIGGVISLLNILTTSTTANSAMFRKMRKYIYFLPLISVPVWMTFPVVSILANIQAFNLYWITSSSVQLIILNLFRNDRFRKFIGIPEYLPGTKLERLNSKNVTKMTFEQPKILSSKPAGLKKKALKE